MVGPEIPGGWRRAVTACFVGTLAVLATALLTRMQLKYRAEIDQFESGQKGIGRQAHGLRRILNRFHHS